MKVAVDRFCARFARTLAGAACALALVLAGGVFVHSQTVGIRVEQKVLESAERKYGATARKRLEDWQQLLDTGGAKSETEKLTLVNSFFNRVPWISDPDHWGKADYWATPVEMLASNGGDCEDFAIGKYFTLVALGVPTDKLKITYVKTRDPNPINQSHMVLAYYAKVDSVPLVLDNLVHEIKSASARPDLTPVYSFNGDGLWLAKERGSGKQVRGGSSNIGFWRELMARMGKEFD
jgi:predicted transglutaminase-like cysteine proteinase